MAADLAECRLSCQTWHCRACGRALLLPSHGLLRLRWADAAEPELSRAQVFPYRALGYVGALRDAIDGRRDRGNHYVLRAQFVRLGNALPLDRPAIQRLYRPVEFPWQTALA